jgi:trehalose 6-phosphate phosphatase
MRLVPASVLDAAIDVLCLRPSALLTDVDGTLSRIVPKPDDACVEPAISRSLEVLHARLSLVAIVTARQKDVAEKMVGVPGLKYIGHYGLASGDGVGGVGEIERMKVFVRPRMREFPCVMFEDKGLSFAIHYRNCAQPEEVREQLLEVLDPVAREAHARLVEGKRVIEMVPGPLPDKGHAVRELQRDHHLNGILYLGDDVGDIAVYSELSRRRREEGLPSFAIAVVDAETDVRVIEAADATIPGVDAVQELLEALAGASQLVPEASNA